MSHNEVRTEQLRTYLNKEQQITNVVEDDTFIYFDTEFITPLFSLRDVGYETSYQETNKGYHARVLKPNWFSHDLEKEIKKYAE